MKIFFLVVYIPREIGMKDLNENIKLIFSIKVHFFRTLSILPPKKLIVFHLLLQLRALLIKVLQHTHTKLIYIASFADYSLFNEKND